MQNTGRNIVSSEYTGNKTIEGNSKRAYLMVVFTEAGTLTVGGGNGAIPFSAGGFWEPYIAPTGKLEIATTGVTTVVEG